MQLSTKQKEIVNSKEDKIVVIASAAAGKSAVVVERIRHLISEGYDPHSIVSLSFTNNAANNVRDRLGNPQGLICNTVHGYANMLLSRAGISTKKVIEREEFDDLFELVKKHPECIQPVEYLTLDEAQDSTSQQFDFIFNYIKPKRWMLVGDPRQTIYRFNSSDPGLLISLSHEKSVKVYDLNENYRNGSEILDYAKQIIRRNGSEFFDDSIPMREEKGKVTFMDYSVSLIPAVIQKSVKEYGMTYGDWFVLCRTNSQLSTIAYALKKLGIPIDTFRQAQLTNDELEKKMNDNTVKVLTIHSSKGLERKNVIVIGANKYNEDETCISYVAATRAEDWLIWTSTPKPTYNKYKKKRSF